MSSAHLRRTPDAIEHHEAVHGALVEVAEQSFFAFVDAVEPAAVQELLDATPSWIRASVVFEGAFGGCLEVALAEPLAIELFVSFLGLDPDERPDDARLFDLVGEFGNMVCGSWLTRSCQRRRFDLHHPDVARVTAEALPPDGPERRILSINGQAACLRLTFQGD
jgi:hypothetical protein